MDGKTLTAIVDKILSERGISRLELCEAIGISSASYTGWKKGSQPRPDKIIAIEKYLGIDLNSYEKCEEQDENWQLREILRDRQDLRILLHSAKDVPPSSVYALVSQLEKMKENDATD